MTTEEKAKAYDEALERARKLNADNMISDEAIEEIFPELCESDDEKMMRVIGLALTDVPEGRFTSSGTTLKDCLAYLEKQKEQKSAEWSEEDKAMRDNILRILPCFVGTAECESNPSLSTSYPLYRREIDWLKSLRPQPHWKPTECQMDSLREIADSLPEGSNLEYLEEVIYALDQQKDGDFSWKPSEEQMRALADTLEDMPEHYKPKCTLETLERDLKNL